MIFDSDILVWQSRGSLPAARVVNDAAERQISIVTLMELLQGARSKSDARGIQQHLRYLQFRILPLSETIGSTAAALVEEYAPAHGLQLADALIAATAIETGKLLCTGNLKHFRPIKNLSCVPFRP